MKKSYHSNTVPAADAVTTSPSLRRSPVWMSVMAASGSGARKAALPCAIGEVENDTAPIPDHEPPLRELRQSVEEQIEAADDADGPHDPGEWRAERAHTIRIAHAQDQ